MINIWFKGKKILSLNNVGSSEVYLLNTRRGVVFPTLVYIIHQGEEKLWILCIGGKKNILTKKRIYPWFLIIHSNGNKEAQKIQNDGVELSLLFCWRKKRSIHSHFSLSQICPAVKSGLEEWGSSKNGAKQCARGSEAPIIKPSCRRLCHLVCLAVSHLWQCRLLSPLAILGPKRITTNCNVHL